MSRVYIDSPFPIEVRSKRSTPKPCVVISLSVNVTRSLVAIVDSTKQLQVVSATTQSIVHSAEGVVSVFFNTEVADMLCYATEDTVVVLSGIGIKDTSKSSSELYEHRLTGQVVGFSGQRIYVVTSAGIAFVGIIISQLGKNVYSVVYTLFLVFIYCTVATVHDPYTHIHYIYTHIIHILYHYK